MHQQNLLRRTAVSAVLLVLVASLQAQTVEPAKTAESIKPVPTPAVVTQSNIAATSTAETEEEPVVLAPFEVRTDKDRGYLAASTTAGSRLNTDLLDTPAAISVFTPEFIRDIGAENIADLANYAMNVDRDYGFIDGRGAAGNNIGNADTQFRVRGVGSASNSQSRFVNYFQTSIENDTFNTERVDFSRGPNSLLFGVASAGGSFNITTKRAHLDRSAYEASVKVGSFQQIRGTVDANLPLIPDKFGIRLNLLSEDKNAWRPYEYREAQRAHLTARYQIARATRLDVEEEIGAVNQARQRPYGVNDYITGWLKRGSILRPDLTTASNQTATGTATSGVSYVYDTASGSVYNWNGQWTTLSDIVATTPTTYSPRPQTPMLFDFSLVPNNVVVGGPALGSEVRYHNTSAFLTHEFLPKLFGEAAFNEQKNTYDTRDVADTGAWAVYFDPNKLLPNGATNPHAGQAYVENTPMTRDRIDRNVSARISLGYELDLGRIFGNYKFAALAESRRQNTQQVEMIENFIGSGYNTTGVDSTPYRVRRRTYVSLTGPAENIAMADFRQQPTIPGYQTAYLPGSSITAQKNETRAVAFATQAFYWHDRLAVTFGLRKDSVDQYTNVAGTTTLNTTAANTAGTTRSLGATFKVADWLILFANQASNFNPATIGWTALPTGKPLEAVDAKGHDYGIKLDLFQKKLYVSADYYDTDVHNDSSFYAPFGLFTNRIWQAFNRTGTAGPGVSILQQEGTTLAAAQVYGNAYNFDSASKGIEIELTANPTNNLRLTLNLSKSLTERSTAGTVIQDYITSHQDYFINQSAYVAGATTVKRGDLLINGPAGNFSTDPNNTQRIEYFWKNNVLSDYAYRVSSTTGQRPIGLALYSLNFRGNYTFDRGALKGFSLGLGTRFRADPIVGYTTDDPTNRQEVRGASDLLVDGSIGYSRKIEIFGHKVDLSTQINVSNLTNKDVVLLQSVYGASPYVAVGTPQNYRLQDPRTWSLTTTITF